MSLVPAHVTSSPKQGNTKLLALGLTEVVIRQAIIDGIRAFNQSTKLHPVNHGGTSTWGEVIASFREQVLSLRTDWKYGYRNGLELTYNEGLDTCIVVCSGDKNTGRVDGLSPRTKNTKGPEVQRFVDHNLDLFSKNAFSLIDEVSVDPTSTWVLLYHIDKANQEVRYELSLPDQMSGPHKNLRINGWKSRICFLPIPFDGLMPTKQATDFNENLDYDLTMKNG